MKAYKKTKPVESLEDLGPCIEVEVYTEEQAKEIWRAGQEYWKTSGASITFEELTEKLKQK